LQRKNGRYFCPQLLLYAVCKSASKFGIQHKNYDMRTYPNVYMFSYILQWPRAIIRFPQVFILEYAGIEARHLNVRNYNAGRYSKAIYMEA
jgi:hypothetical protein